MDQCPLLTFYHSKKGIRTAVHLDLRLANYLAVSLGVTPGTPEAVAAIKAWSDKSLDETSINSHLPLSAQVRLLAIDRIYDQVGNL